MKDLPLFDQLFAGTAEPNRAAQILKRFKQFHADNPKVWIWFQQFAWEAINAGKQHYSADAIFHRIRWHVEIETRQDASVKLNNDYTALYARLFAVAYPQQGEFFQQRKRTSVERPADPLDPQVHYTGPAQGESALISQLTELAHLSSRV